MNLRMSNPFKLRLITPNRIVALCFLAALSILTVSCDDDDNKPAGQYADGVFVVNEGNFGSGNGTITHFSKSKVTTQDLFGLVNNGLALGDVIQSMIVDDDAAYIVVNNSKKIEVVDAGTFERVGTITGLSLPRYVTIDDGFAYVTEWVSFTDLGRVSVIDLKTNEVIDKITVEAGAENLLKVGGLLFVSNNFTNTVSVIDIEDRVVVKTVTVASSPGELLEDVNGKIWVVCGGSYGGNDGALVQIDADKSNKPNEESVVKTIALDMNLGFPKAAISPDGRNLFYFSGKTVYKFDVTATSAPADAFITETNATNFYGIGIDHKTAVLYVADDKGFSSSGTVFRYELSGPSIDNFTTGIGPNGFAFHD
jgi:YVTN family beta-propeller protein